MIYADDSAINLWLIMVLELGWIRCYKPTRELRASLPRSVQNWVCLRYQRLTSDVKFRLIMEPGRWAEDIENLKS